MSIVSSFLVGNFDDYGVHNDFMELSRGEKSMSGSMDSLFVEIAGRDGNCQQICY